jgi:hypothetical protein
MKSQQLRAILCQARVGRRRGLQSFPDTVVGDSRRSDSPDTIISRSKITRHRDAE